MTNALRIAVVTGGRFHVLDLARELAHIGHQVLFYSWIPRSRAVSFGLPPHCHVDLFYRLAPIAAWTRYLPKYAPSTRKTVAAALINDAVRRVMQPCDVFIGMSGLTLESARFAKTNFGAKIFIERGSQHILAQGQILRAAGMRAPTKAGIIRELQSYALADQIVVPSGHVAASFQCDPASAKKLFKNPYGVALDHFPSMHRPSSSTPCVLFVGGWSKRKGCDVLIRAIEELPSVKLLHVGPIIDLPFPSHPQFEHVPPVPQLKLSEYYARANVFALASREEGLAMVLPQALASGLPIVCTDKTGGADLAHNAGLTERIRVVPSDDHDALREALTVAIATPPPLLLPSDRDALSWSNYAQRYSDRLLLTSNITRAHPCD